MKALSLEKDKELQLCQARGREEDRQALLEDVQAEVEIIQSSLSILTNQAANFVEKWTNYSESGSRTELGCSGFNPLDVGEEDLETQASHLRDQLLFEEKNVKQSQAKLLPSKLECQKCEESLTLCKNKFKQTIEGHGITKTYLGVVSNFLARLKSSVVDLLHPSPVERISVCADSRVIAVSKCPVCDEDFQCNDIYVPLADIVTILRACLPIYLVPISVNVTVV